MNRRVSTRWGQAAAPSCRQGIGQARPEPPVHDDLVLRDFTAEQPHQLWLT
jgi:hypothetical protein